MKFITSFFYVFVFVFQSQANPTTNSTIQNSGAPIKPVIIDTVLAIDLPSDYFQDDDNEDDIRSLYWFAYDDDDVTYMVHKAWSDEALCIRNSMELQEFYKITIGEWMDLSPGMSVKGNEQFQKLGVQMAAFTFEDQDEETGEKMISDFRMIQIKEELYQVGIIQPSKTLDRSKNEAFFNSIRINDKFLGANQFPGCENVNVTYQNESDAYKAGYESGTFILGVLCTIIPLGLIILVIVLIVRHNKKKKQREWEKYN